MHEPVDAVITWVDGHDPAHQKKLSTYLQSLNRKPPESAAPTRFNQCGELDFCVKSLLRYAPWIRKIFIVTDAQQPEIMRTLQGTPFENRVSVIDHQNIFKGFEDVLPSFNSLAIETMLIRIEGLSEKFIYLNDDCSLIRPVRYEDFFREDKIVFRGEWKTMTDHQWLHYGRRFLNQLRSLVGLKNKPEPLNEHRVLQEKSARLAGFNKQFFHLPHAPHPMRKSTLEQFFLHHPKKLLKNISYPLRDPHQFWPMSLACHLELKLQTAMIDNTLKTIMVNGACHTLKKIIKRLSKAGRKSNVAFVCMQSVDMAPSETRALMMSWLKDMESI